MELLVAYALLGAVFLPFFHRAPLWLAWPYLLVFPFHAPIAVVLKCMVEPIVPYMNERRRFF